MQINAPSSTSIYINNHKNEADTSLNKIASAKVEPLSDASLALIAHAIGSDIGALSQGLQNANDAVAMMQIADGALSALSQGADDLKVLSVKSNNAALSSENRDILQAEASKITDVMNQSIEGATFNGSPLFGRNLEFSLGTSSLSVSLDALSADGISIDDEAGIEALMQDIASVQSSVGSASKGIESAIHNNLSQMKELSAAKSQMSDSDIAKESNNFSKESIQLHATLLAQSHRNDIDAQKVQMLLA